MDITVGSGGDYADIDSALATLTGGLAEDTHITIISSFTVGVASQRNIALNGYTLTIDSDDPHGGDPTAGNIITVSHTASASALLLSVTGTGTCEIKDLNLVAASGSTAATTQMTVYSAGPDLLVHDCIVDLAANTAVGARGIVVGSNSGASGSTDINVWNCAGNGGSYPFQFGNGYGASVVIENCSASNATWAGIDCQSQSMTVRNCVSVGSTTSDFASVGSATGYNNASEDSTATTFGSGSGGINTIVPANEFVSTSISSSDYMKVKSGGSLDDGGTTTTIAGNTAGIRGDARPGSDALYSIGADELSSIPAPAPTSVTPSSGVYYGGTSVSIYGSNFVSGATVTIGGASATGVTFVDSGQIDCVTPAGTPGDVDVVVTNPDLQDGTLVDGFTYQDIAVTSVSPNEGLKIGGTSVTVYGTSFNTGVTVTFDGNPATDIVRVSATQITCKTPAGEGVVDVVATNLDMNSGTLTGGFAYEIREVTIVVPAQIGEGGAGIFRSSPGLGDVLNKIAVNLSQIQTAATEGTFAEFAAAMDAINMLQYVPRRRYATAYPAGDPEPISVPDRMGEGFVGLNRAQTSEYLVGLKDILDRIALMLEELQEASQLADYAAFKTAVANLSVLSKSSDSRI